MQMSIGPKDKPRDMAASPHALHSQQQVGGRRTPVQHTPPQHAAQPPRGGARPGFYLPPGGALPSYLQAQQQLLFSRGYPGQLGLGPMDLNHMLLQGGMLGPPDPSWLQQAGFDPLAAGMLPLRDPSGAALATSGIPIPPFAANHHQQQQAFLQARVAERLATVSCPPA